MHDCRVVAYSIETHHLWTLTALLNIGFWPFFFSQNGKSNLVG